MVRLTALAVLLTPVILFTSFGAQPQKAPAPPLVEKFLIEGKLADGEKALISHLEANPNDDEARFGLGVLQFLRAIERLGQSLYQYQPRTNSIGLRNIPLLRLPVPANPNPESVSYAKMRGVLEALLGDLRKAEATLAAIKNPRPLKLPLHFGLIRLDLNGDGKADDDEALWRLYSSLTGRRLDQVDAAQFVIKFDEADVYWLQGYCHLLMAVNEMVLAHSFKDVFERAGHLAFAKVDSPYSYLKREPEKKGDWLGSQTELADLIALIHCLNFPVEEPARMKSALGHLKRVIDLSRKTWKAIDAEEDDDHEWLPGPRQTGIIPGVRISKEMVAGWHEFLDEADEILAGKKLVPHWRVDDGRGVNLRKVFEQPRAFDLVLWITGTGPEPFLERGTSTQPAFWERMQRLFQGQFIGFAVWIN